MEHVGSIAHKRYSYSQSKSNSSIAIEEKLSREEEDLILDSYPELISQNYRGWFIKKLRVKGKTQFTGLADRAMKYGNDKQKMFVHLLG